jgi:hypothetical protein
MRRSEEKYLLFLISPILWARTVPSYIKLWSTTGSSLYNSCADKEWPTSKSMLVRDAVVAIFSVIGRLTASRRGIIQSQHGVPQTISVEEENGVSRDLEQSRKARLKIELRSLKSKEHRAKNDTRGLIFVFLRLAVSKWISRTIKFPDAYLGDIYEDRDFSRIEKLDNEIRSTNLA